MPSLEYAMEELGVALLQQSGTLSPLTIVHFGNTTKAQQNRIVVRAKRGKQQLDGPRCFPVTLSAEYVVIRTQPQATVEGIIQEMEKTLSIPGITAALAVFTPMLPNGGPLAPFSELHYEPSGEDERENEERHTRRSVETNWLSLTKLLT